MVPSSTKILIGISLSAEAGMELLSWAVGFAARPNDTVVALHVLVGKEKNSNSIAMQRTKMRHAKAFVISMLGEFTETCQVKQVNLEARVVHNSSVEKGLIDEATSLEASFLLVGGSKNRSQTSLEITNYCFKHAPEGCAVIAIQKRRQPPHQDSDSDSISYEGIDQSSSGWPNKDAHSGKSLSSLQKLFSSKIRRVKSFNKKENLQNINSPIESIDEKPSPRTVLDGPERGTHIVDDDCISLADSSITESPPLELKVRESNHGVRGHSGSNIRKSLSTIKLLFPFFHSKFQETGRGRDKCLSNKEIHQPSWRCFSYEEISHATNNFHPDNVVGRGGFAEVYRGNLYDGQTIAVKRLAKDNTDEQKEKEFLMELGIVGHVCHPNTVHLIGCCIENGLHLIFDFSPNGSLASALHGRSSELLEWPIRYKIVIGVTSGLHYLHKCCKHRIIHRDIKASNVLLGPNFEPQISDFGLAKWLPKQWTHHSVIPIEGTFGYLAPEYFMHGVVDEKTDVFAFGVLLLEIITGRMPVDSSKKSLLQWAKPLIESGNFSELADLKLDGKYDMDQMQRIALTASYCVRPSSIRRPSMREVLQILNDGHDSKIAESWRMPEYRVDEVDDYIMDINC